MVQTGQSSHSVSALQFIKPPHVLILEARFYDDVNDHLVAGTIEALDKAHATWEKLTVPGALEIPVALQYVAQRKNGRLFDAFVVLGCVIRGETTHYEIVSNESARGVMEVSLKHNLAVGNGILTVENLEQAMDRADKVRQNKGGGAAIAALSMLHLKQVCGHTEE
ncbi:MAG: 6,7-dimethyl-8-ribityllumazine synthase [Pseudobdellovibrionaceae bacterium]|jgi:6,7-dimethyl-8-ribityllumazine synthase|nr:6,7-dimethyl-8-ribityllumazine synthase [Pseudobdellovibrionaceae bacterium]